MGGIEPKHNHSDRDKIYTPIEIAQKLISKIPAEQGDSWCDPCFGNGEFFDNFPPNQMAEWFEIDKGKDFLLSNSKWDWVATNIPFSKPKEFIFKMAESCNKGFGILCLANSMTATRLKKLEDMDLFVHSCTPLYIKKWGFGCRTDFYVFTKEKNNQFETIII